ncbi:hypothetical protein A2W14_06525 [Candidatus Gottesmanbacteria bacterium RBG_16_37_8]|uniref:Antitoxin n=1 Tax=Candidatus Gottesmanbacteria bacterium RBG_16_37_8 TaxID=1798371 RepID=A0A1F5YQ92_9BACT|nr:MAG: hypothetical protein A2W14_06525 [Candidatus Gottesmanbacteria bacterium RBG_16_37_8]
MNNYNDIISITELRRNFGEITKNLALKKEIILTRGGEPFAILKPAPNVKRKLLMKAAGAWKNTELDDDKLWKKVLIRKSRKKPITL